MQAGDANRVVGHAQADEGRAERLAWVAGCVPAQVHEALEGNADLGQVAAEHLVDQARFEVVAAGGHRRVGREEDAGPRHQARLLKGELPALAQLPDPFGGHQEAVAFVHVEDGGFDAHGPQRAHSADAEHDLLAQAAVGLRRVEAVADGPEVGRVVVEIGVEQEERHPAHRHAPDGDPGRAVADGDLHEERSAGRVGDPLHG